MHAGAVSLTDDKQQKTQKDDEMDDGPITGLKTTEFPAKSWRRLGFSQHLWEGIPESRGRVGESPEAKLFFGMVFIHTWNTKVRLRRWSKRLWWFLMSNQLLKTLWSCATKAVLRQWKNLVVNTILHRKPVEIFQDSLNVFSLLCQSHNPCCCVLCKLKTVQFPSPHKQLLQ